MIQHGNPRPDGDRLMAPPLEPGQCQAAVDWAIASRRSIRAFLPTPVDRSMVDDILRVARYAASGVNTQPWRVRILYGSAKARLSDSICALNDDPEAVASLAEPYDYYPIEWKSPYIERRRKVGWDLYGLLGIAKGDRERMHAQHARNYRFFDAPVGLIFTLDRLMREGSFIDYGMFLQNVMLAARARGLDTCPQVAFTRFHQVICAQLQIPDSELVVCGMSLGYADGGEIENTLVTERAEAADFTTYHGLD